MCGGLIPEQAPLTQSLKPIYVCDKRAKMIYDVGNEIMKATRKNKQKVQDTSVNSVYKWIHDHNYLSDHIQCVVVNGTKSTSLPNHSGVPQRIVLGPLCTFQFIK